MQKTGHHALIASLGCYYCSFFQVFPARGLARETDLKAASGNWKKRVVCACVRVCAGMCVSPVGLCMHSHACVYVPCGCLLCKCVYLCVMACVCPSVGVCKCTCVCVFWSQTRSYLCRVITLSGLVAFGEPGVGVALELIIAWPWSCPRVKSQWVICRVLFTDSTGLGYRQYLRSATSLAAKGTS